ncbi:hypothetical protein E8D34_04720 [Nocardioides sp. GY 10113]|uniref:hypothetical protein n=1 Tax=Nocardioides sp. GY 10113 TaxID=2569761 RepID=UPI0010A7AD82|nr:hypothetical protein [Nocardioides sp. GY 10113]TIC88246.1 hypothetical protein E8D34_04720 [Nocardioides sp. GY 10113]
MKVVERVVDQGHDIGECVHRVINSPRAAANVLTALAALARADMLSHDNRWQPAVRALAALNEAIRGKRGARW